MPWPVVVLLAVLASLVLRWLVLEPFAIPSGSMEPELEPGDRVLVLKVGTPGNVDRGDVVVFDGTSTFGKIPQETAEGRSGLAGWFSEFVAGRTGESDYVKRVIGVGGDRVKCCTRDGRITVNGVAVKESYVFAGDDPSSVKFDVTVPPGRLWLMGDHRSDSADSRAHLGKPGGGTVAETDVIGPVVVRFMPFARWGTVSGAPELAAIPRAGSSQP